MVFVKRVEKESLNPELQKLISPNTVLYAVFDQEGQQLALVKDSRIAFVLARQNDFVPMWAQ